MEGSLIRVGGFMEAEALERFLRERAEQKQYALDEAWREWGQKVYEEYGIYPIGGAAISAAYSVASASAFAATTGAKTALLAISPAGHGLALTEWGISMDGVTSSAVPALVDVVTSTQGTAGTSGETPTITQCRGRSTGGSAPTGGSKYSAEPTTITRHRPVYVPQFNGTYIYQAPLGREIECDSSAGTVKAIGVRINVSANVNVVGWLEVEAVG